MSVTTMRWFPDVEGALRTYLRNNAYIVDLVDNRVFLGMPDNMPNTSFPCITLAEVGPGAVDPGDAPLSWELIQCDCWGLGRNKANARQVRDALIAVMESMPSGTLMDANTRAVGARTFSGGYAPDPDNGQARYRVDVYIMASRIVTGTGPDDVFPDVFESVI